MDNETSNDAGGESSHQESQAREQGWVPLTEFRGDKTKWMEANDYLERGQQVLPILRHHNKQLRSELDSVKSQMQVLKQTVTEQNESMEDLKVFHQESTKAQVEKARREILADLKAAKQEGDIDQEIKITADLSRFDAAQVQAEKKPEPKEVTQPTQKQLDAVTEQWISATPWYGKDLARTRLMHGAAQELRMTNPELSGMEFLKACEAIVVESFGEDKPVSKAEGAGRGGAGGGESRGSVSYNSLPSEAKAVCDKQALKFVGENKAYKTKKDWQDFYATEYFKGH